jgi:23S rRNA (cytidine1920-2'-O)/16S rRNA (cytidine1409-2'-O)-methyltransferase
MTQFASRAGEKLQFALDTFKINASGLVVADFGSSTGGFVDCLLQNGVAKVYSVDVSYGELAWTLRNDPKVKVLERTNAMHVTLPEKVDLITIDTGWTKQKLVVPNALANLAENGQIIALIKPHYEADKKFLVKGRLQDEKIEEVINQVKLDIAESGGKVIEIAESPIVGEKGKNREFLALVARSD